jgi:hypothetical protein
VDDDFRCAGFVYDFARIGTFLWRIGSLKKRSVDHGSMSRDYWPRHDSLVGGRV